MAIHYIVGVGIQPMTSSSPAEKYIDFLLTYTDSEVEKIILAKSMIDNKLWKTKPVMALEACNILELANNWSFISLRARVHGLMICHFTSEDDLHFTREDLELIIKHKDINDLKRSQVFI